MPDWREAHGIDRVFGPGSTTTLRRHVTRLEASTAARLEAAPHRGKVRRFKEFHDGAGTRIRVRRIVARVEAGPQGGDTRFIVTDLCAMARGGSSARVRTASVAGPGTT